MLFRLLEQLDKKNEQNYPIYNFLPYRRLLKAAWRKVHKSLAKIYGVTNIYLFLSNSW